jgi:hypothetical protein
MAVIFATIDGNKDARNGKPAYFWALIFTSGHRKELIKDGWKHVAKIFIIAIILDIVYQQTRNWKSIDDNAKTAAGTARFLARIRRPSLPDLQTGASIRLGAGTPHTTLDCHLTLGLVTALGAVGNRTSSAREPKSDIPTRH